MYFLKTFNSLLNITRSSSLQSDEIFPHKAADVLFYCSSLMIVAV